MLTVEPRTTIVATRPVPVLAWSKIVHFVEPDKIGIVFLDGNLKALAGWFVLSDVVTVLQSPRQIRLAMLGMKGQFDVQDNGIHE